MKINYLVYAFLMLSFLACKPKEKGNEQNNNNAVQKVVEANPYPGVPVSFLEMLMQKTIGIDYFFRGTNFSVSQSDPTAIRSAIGTLAYDVPSTEYGASCNSPCRVTFVGNDGILTDIEMYMGDGCNFLLYYIDGKPKYSSPYTEPGYNFINNMKIQAANAHPGAQQ